MSLTRDTARFAVPTGCAAVLCTSGDRVVAELIGRNGRPLGEATFPAGSVVVVTVDGTDWQTTVTPPDLAPEPGRFDEVVVIDHDGSIRRLTWAEFGV